MDLFSALDAAPRREDNRGWLQVLYETERMVLKRSFSRAGVFRGMHVQLAPASQEKLIRVVSGRIIDFVATVLDPMPTISHTEIGPEQGWVRIDARLAHGFYAREDTVFEYVCDGGYDESAERSYSILDYIERECGIVDPILSDKDKAAHPITWHPAAGTLGAE